MKEVYKPLFEPFTFRNGVQLKNRIVMAPMTTFSANPDDTASDAEIDYYAARSNGPGMVITACAYVQENGKGFEGQFAADRDTMIQSLRRVASSIKEKGAKAIIQLYHGGRLAVPHLIPDGETVSASSVAPLLDRGFYSIDQTPCSLSDEEVIQLIKDFGEATRRAIEAGFDGVELHGASGYIIQQFFSPHSNTRTDRWGGNIEKPLAFPLAVIEEVKRVMAEHAKQPFILGYRLSPEEPETPGITMAETFILLDALADAEPDYIHMALNDFWSKPRRGVESNRSRVELIQEHVGNRVPIIGVGSIHTPDQAIEALEKTRIPFVALGRELIMEPQWVEKVEQGKEKEIKTTINPSNQALLTIPDPLWELILDVPGWFPIEKETIQK
ncbi:NADH-dependent flavin oxidoreductase [Metabacillus rhizolycopersici]|uniref:NADH-dependent flavin oxidoreductase n=1 Tax=Metabacillus rhizolycopersici TaxID=2875709 RepID=A0ABS7UXT4_9BACI|nr:NADH-dependent flavin oxidoreductase [Metabacillus rhizolycopersici]MBZ5752739.1 NADH-dependent flavin oxidoreductase [Metabacillus rhizolycopersici]